MSVEMNGWSEMGGLSAHDHVSTADVAVTTIG